MDKKMVFSRNKFLAHLNSEKDKGILIQQDIDYAFETWANSIVGKTLDEITEILGEHHHIKDEWMEEVEIETTSSTEGTLPS